MFPGHRVPPSSLSHVSKPEASTIKPQSCCHATGFNQQTSLMSPGNRVSESNQCMFPRHGVPLSDLSHVPIAQVSSIKPQSCGQSTGFCNQTPVKFPGHKVPESSLSHVARPQGSRIKPQSCCRATGFQNQTVVMFPGHRIPESADVSFPGHRVPESILSYVPRLQGSRINLSHVPSPQGSRTKAQSVSQGTVFHNLNRCHVLRPQFSRITPQSCSQATGIQNQTSVKFPGHRFPESSLSHVARSQTSRIMRSEERRVGKECRSRWSPYH